MTNHSSAASLVHVSVDKLNVLSERILALSTCTTTCAGNEIPHRFLLAIFEELSEMTVELVIECHKLKGDLLAA